MAGKEEDVSMEGFFRREGGETSSGITVDAQTHSISVESTTLEARIDAVLMEARNNLTPSAAPKIQKVIFFLRDQQDLQKHYEPEAVSFGPIHHGSEKCKLGEKYKRILTSEFVEGSKEMINDLYKKIGEKIKELKECFEKEVIEGYDDEDLIWLLLVDGCAILQYIDCVVKNRFAVLKIKPESIFFIDRDLFLLENQLPYCLLNWLMTWCANENELRRSIDTYFQAHLANPHSYDQSVIFSWKWLSSLSWRCSHYAELENEKEESPHSKAKLQKDPIHLLDLVRTRLLGNHQRRNYPKHFDFMATVHGNVQELRAAGIHLERTKMKNSGLRNIHFTKLGCLGYLWLPPITVDDLTGPMFSNLIAYEMCRDFKNDFEINSYISFLDSLIREANDVKELRKAGILYNFLGSDDEVARVFNEIGTGSWMANIEYSNVRSEICKHYNHMLKVWIGQFFYYYFDSPWTFLSLVGALLALALTAIQTWYAIDSPCDNFCKNYM